ncbi:transcriptional regulatory protein [Paramyrothecium foliicola]|nr:transcriptional regulatory protein [Paramyrothecium foliicola]
MQNLPALDPAGTEDPIERRACDQCRQRKIRCDKDSPCFNCRSTKRSCTSIGVGPRPKETRQRVLISSQYEKKIDRIENRLANIETLLKDLAINPHQSFNHDRLLPTPQASSVAGAASTVDCDTSDDESAFGGDSAISAHTAFASEFLQRAVHKTPMPEVDPKMEAALANLSQLVEMQRHRSISHGPRFPLQRSVPPGGLSQLPMPPMAAVVAALKQVKAAPSAMFTAVISLVSIKDFSALCRMVYFATEEISDPLFLIVNTGLYNLFSEQHALNADPSRLNEYRSYTELCQVNIETGLANLPLWMTPKVENVQALLLGAFYAIDHSRPSVAWHLNCIASQLCLTGGYHRVECMSVEPPAVAQVKKNLFWQLYALDKGLSLRIGRASVIRDCDIDIPREFNFDGFSPSIEATVPNSWIPLGNLQGRIFEELYSPAALAAPQAVLIERAKALAVECSRLYDLTQQGRDELMAQLEEANSSKYLEIFLRGDTIQMQVTLTLIYRIIPAPEGSMSRFCNECLDAARKTMQMHQDTMHLLDHGHYGKLIYFHWNLLLTPFAPFFILFCYVIETSSAGDLLILEQFVASLREARDASETVEKLYRLCQVMYDIAALYTEAKSKQQQDANMVSIGDEFQMYLSQLGFMPAEDQGLMGPDLSQTGPGPGQAAQAQDWFMGQKMIGLLDQDLSQMEGYQWMQPGPM